MLRLSPRVWSDPCRVTHAVARRAIKLTTPLAGESLVARAAARSLCIGPAITETGHQAQLCLLGIRIKDEQPGWRRTCVRGTYAICSAHG